MFLIIQHSLLSFVYLNFGFIIIFLDLSLLFSRYKCWTDLFYFVFNQNTTCGNKEVGDNKCKSQEGSGDEDDNNINNEDKEDKKQTELLLQKEDIIENKFSEKNLCDEGSINNFNSIVPIGHLVDIDNEPDNNDIDNEVSHHELSESCVWHDLSSLSLNIKRNDECNYNYNIGNNNYLKCDTRNLSSNTVCIIKEIVVWIFVLGFYFNYQLLLLLLSCNFFIIIMLVLLLLHKSFILYIFFNVIIKVVFYYIYLFVIYYNIHISVNICIFLSFL